MAADKRPRAKTTPVTVLFTDITASTTLYVERGDPTAFALTSACLDFIAEHVAAASGRVVRRLGDGVLAVFDHPETALITAAKIRTALEEPSTALAAEGMRVRSGIATGPAVVASDDVYGDVVNVAARLANLAFVDEILLSGRTYERLPPPLRAQSRVIDQMSLRNRPLPILVYEFMPVGGDATVSAAARSRTVTTTMEVTCGDLLLVVGPERQHVTIGRDRRSDICLTEDLVSRSHAVIDLRGDKFVLADHSINGTYVHLADGTTLRVLREEIVLTGNGRIAPGSESAPPILYSVAAL